MKRYTYQGLLRFPYGFHTGDGRRLASVDQPLCREADGRIALSGASLAGVLRADLERLSREREGVDCERTPACRCVVCRLFGSRPERRRRDGAAAALQASRLHVAGGVAPGEPPTRVRDRVGIDRRTRTAADKRKYELEIVEAGLEIPFELRLDDPLEDERRYLEATLFRLAGRWLFLGGKSSSGLGLAELIRLDRAELDLSNPAHLVEHLLGASPTAGALVIPLLPRTGAVPETLPPAAPAAGPSPGWGQLRIALELHFPWGFLVNDPAESLASGVDHTYTRGGEGQPLLPGSALRGALRSRAEQILRTLGGDAAACDLNRKSATCHEKVEQELRTRGAMSFDDELALHCQACRVFGSGRLASAVKITDFLPPSTGHGNSLRQELVAIDRFTGGAAEGAKFNAELRTGVTLVGEIHLEIGRHRLESWSLGLLALVLRDLLLADIPMGFGTAKGFNEYTARITGIDRYWLRPPAAFAGLAGLDSRPGEKTWAPSSPLDSPATAGALAGDDLGERLTSWILELHRQLSPGAEEPQ
jgi:CRISPR/Cas system CSM-associated protein Csm3 (group 7 of RAMP superfamily)